jgi:hypothetical protein
MTVVRRVIPEADFVDEGFSFFPDMINQAVLRVSPMILPITFS